MKVHCHVYKVVKLQEVDFYGANEEEATRDALQHAIAHPNSFREPDCRYVAVSFPAEGTEPGSSPPAAIEA